MLLGILGCGFQFVQMFESLVLRDGLQERHYRYVSYVVNCLRTHQIHILKGKYHVQIAVRAGGFSALVVVGMAVIGIAILYAIFYVWLEVDSPGSMKVTDCMC